MQIRGAKITVFFLIIYICFQSYVFPANNSETAPVSGKAAKGNTAGHGDDPQTILNSIQNYYNNIFSFSGLMKKNVLSGENNIETVTKIVFNRPDRYLKDSVAGGVAGSSFDGVRSYIRLSDGRVSVSEAISKTAEAEDVVVNIENTLFFKPMNFFGGKILTMTMRNKKEIIIKVRDNNESYVIFIDARAEVIERISKFRDGERIFDFICQYKKNNGFIFPSYINNTYYYPGSTINEKYTYSDIEINKAIDATAFMLSAEGE